MKIGFDNDKYLKMQSEHIKERIAKFDEEIKAKTEHEISGIKKELEDSREKQVRQLSDESHEKFRTIDSYYENSRERIADEIFNRIIRK